MKLNIQNDKSGILLSLSKTEKITHLVSWIGFLIVMLISSMIIEDKPIWLVLPVNLFLELLYALFFYLLIFHIYSLWYTNKLGFYFRAFVTTAFFTFLFFSYDYWLEPWSGFDTTYSFSDSLVGAVLSAFIFIVVSIAVFAYKYSIAKIRYLSQKEVQLACSRQQLTQRELELTKLELHSYRNIFNTHLTFNTLSHIHAKVAEDQSVAIPLLLLSENLRYNLKTKGHQLVSLSEEIHYIQDYFELYHHIFPGLQVSFTVEGDTQSIAVLPRVFLNYVENALKHGKRNDQNHPIKVRFWVDDKVRFSVSNAKKLNYTGVSTGVGLENTYQILKAYYGEEFTLDIQDQDSSFEVKLSLPKVAYHGDLQYYSPLSINKASSI
ncbi:two-component system LytT family sensor kinase [Catalinimonas alkaloidigena]|uniref:sensor histidine kinase n=1 Tax=Catalinimonas TaxID=1522128 RepID=UPI002404CA26|nr:histidine kinase [Catalinimonas alkaloidigena]MDF9799074.1 two-component system LytT family sensor kinase [Catalinimonas alkaloidigena]